ncbi:MAG: hypothetical protein OHK0053_05170 [Microscillaceae bacterium]
MRYLLFWLWGLFLAPLGLLAQTDNALLSPRAVGLGRVSVILADEGAIWSNPAGLTVLEQATITGTYENRFGFSAFQTFALGGVLPFAWPGAAGLSLSRFGDALYNELKIGLGYAHQIDLVSLGFKINYVQVAQQDLDSKGSFAFELGGLVNITPCFVFAAHIYNFNQGQLRAESTENEALPVVMRAGVGYQFSDNLLLGAEVEKDLDFPASVRVGLEYRIAKPFWVRTGIRTAPFDVHGGLGLRHKRWLFDGAISTQSNLGITFQFSLGYRWGQLQKRPKKNANE